MNPTPQSPAPRRRVWRWVLIGAGICLAPFVLLGIAAISYLTLDRDVTVLRRHVMDATGARWNTKVQVSVGNLTLGSVRQGLRFIEAPNIDEARQALRAVKHASVGVYERSSGGDEWSREQMFVETDRAMRQRGWTRMVGVTDRQDSVLVYVPKDMDDDGPVDICIAVVNRKELVVVSTTVDADALCEIATQHMGKELKGHLRLSKLRL